MPPLALRLVQSLLTTAVLFIVPSVVIVLAINVTAFFASSPHVFLGATQHALALSAILATLAGATGAAAAYALQRRIARETLTPIGHFFIGWPVYLLAGWLALNWFVSPPDQGALRASQAQILAIQCLGLSLGVGLVLHLTLTLADRLRDKLARGV